VSVSSFGLDPDWHVSFEFFHEQRHFTKDEPIMMWAHYRKPSTWKLC